MNYSELMLNSSKKLRAKGFSLIEVLIAMLILAFGVLSMGGLQLASLRSSQSAGNYSTATTLAKDYTEMMRSNWSVATNTATGAPANPYLFDSASTPTYTVTPANTCQAAACTAAQMSVLHVADWAARVQAQLPGARAVVCRDPGATFAWSCGANNGTALTIKIGWIDKRDQEERGVTATLSATPLAPQFVINSLTGFSE